MSQRKNKEAGLVWSPDRQSGVFAWQVDYRGHKGFGNTQNEALDELNRELKRAGKRPYVRYADRVRNRESPR